MEEGVEQESATFWVDVYVPAVGEKVGVAAVGLLLQLTATLETFPEAVPVPLVTVHVCPVGWLETVTAYVLPLVIGVAKVKELEPEVEVV